MPGNKVKTVAVQVFFFCDVSLLIVVFISRVGNH